MSGIIQNCLCLSLSSAIIVIKLAFHIFYFLQCLPQALDSLFQLSYLLLILDNFFLNLLDASAIFFYLSTKITYSTSNVLYLPLIFCNLVFDLCMIPCCSAHWSYSFRSLHHFPFWYWLAPDESFPPLPPSFDRTFSFL